MSRTLLFVLVLVLILAVSCAPETETVDTVSDAFDAPDLSGGTIAAPDQRASAQADIEDAEEVLRRALQARMAGDATTFSQYVLQGYEWLWDKVSRCDGGDPDRFTYRIVPRNDTEVVIMISEGNRANGGFILQAIGDTWLLADWAGEVTCDHVTPPTPTPKPTPVPPPLTLIVYNYELEDQGDGWSIGSLNLAIENTSASWFIPGESELVGSFGRDWLLRGQFTVETAEGPTYSLENFGSHSLVPIPPYYRVNLDEGDGIGGFEGPLALTFRAATAATPIRIVWQIADTVLGSIDLPEPGSETTPEFPLDQVDLITQPPSSLNGLRLDLSENVSMTFTGRCAFDIETRLSGPGSHLEVTIVNSDLYNEVDLYDLAEQSSLGMSLFDAETGSSRWLDAYWFIAGARTVDGDFVDELGPGQQAIALMQFGDRSTGILMEYLRFTDSALIDLRRCQGG